MKNKAYYLLVLGLLLTNFCQAQKNKDSLKLKFLESGVYNTTTPLTFKDSCWWTKKIDTIKIDFVIVVDENNFVKKQKADFIIHEYEKKDCTVVLTFNQPYRNDVFLLNNKPIEVLLYKPKGQNMLLGNSR